MPVLDLASLVTIMLVAACQGMRTGCSGRPIVDFSSRKSEGCAPQNSYGVWFLKLIYQKSKIIKGTNKMCVVYSETPVT